MKTYTFPIQFATRLNVPADFPQTLKVVAGDIHAAQEMLDKAVKRHYTVNNPNMLYALGFLRKDDEESARYLAEKGITVEDGDTTGITERKLKEVGDSGYLSDLDTDPESAIKYIREAQERILEDHPEARSFCIDVSSDHESSYAEFKMSFMRPESQAEHDLRVVVEQFEAAARKADKLAQLEALKRELGEG